MLAGSGSSRGGLLHQAVGQCIPTERLELLAGSGAGRRRTGLRLAVADDEHVGHLLLLGQPDLVLHPVGAVVHLDAQAPAPKSIGQLALPSDVLRVEASVLFGPASGSDSRTAGVMCSAASGLPRSLVAGIDRETWWLGRMIDGRLQVIEEGRLRTLAGRPDPLVEPVTVAVECASVPESRGDYVLVAIDGQPVGVGTFPRLEIPVGPYDKAGILSGVLGGRVSDIFFDDFTVLVGDEFAPLGEPLPDAWGDADAG